MILMTQIVTFYRAIGLVNNDVVKLQLYESISNLFGASIIGLVVGVVGVFMMNMLFFAFLEIPMILIVSHEA